MKRINHFNTARDKLLHIETEGCIVNIRIGLQNHEGQNVTHIEILPDRNGDGCGNPSWRIADNPDAQAENIRLVQQK